MAKRAVFFGQLTDEMLNGTEGYRVSFSYGVFSIAPKVTQSGTYHYAVKRHKGQLFKVYVGKAGTITPERLHRATMALHDKIQLATGKVYPRDNRPRKVTHWEAPCTH